MRLYEHSIECSRVNSAMMEDNVVILYVSIIRGNHKQKSSSEVSVPNRKLSAERVVDISLHFLGICKRLCHSKCLKLMFF